MDDTDAWPPVTWRERLDAARASVVWWLWSVRHPIRRWGPRCGAIPPWRLTDAGRCCLYHGHTADRDREDRDWHFDGNGYVWNDVLGRWRWTGPILDLSDALGYYEFPEGDYRAVFTEGPPCG